MRKLFLASLVFSLGSAFAANQSDSKSLPSENLIQKSTPVVLTDPTIMQKGFRVSVGTGNREFELITDLNDSDEVKNSESGQATTIAIGYQSFQVGYFGFMVDFSRTTQKIMDAEFTYTGFEGSGVYGVNEKVYVFGGVNLLKVTADTGSSFQDRIINDFNTGTGAVVGAGLKANKYLSIEAKVVSTSWSQYYSESEGLDFRYGDLELNVGGLQVGLIGTF